MASKKNVEQIVIVRAYAAGVHVGRLVSREGDIVTLADTTRLYRWVVARQTGQVASCSELALYGVKPAECKFGAKLPRIEIHGVAEVIPCSPKAAETYP